MGASITQTTVADLPGADVVPELVDEQADMLAATGDRLQDDTAALLRAWQKVPASYESTGADAVYDAMLPADAAGQHAGEAMKNAAKALKTYAEEARAILKKVDALKTRLLDFQTGTEGYPKKGTIIVAHGTAKKTYDSWRDDPQAVEANHQLGVDAQHLEGELLQAQEKCANAIRAAAGLAAKGKAAVAAEVKALNATDWHWNAQVAINNDQEGCAGSTSRALNGIFYDGIIINGAWGTVQGLGGLIGWDGDHDWSWDTAGKSWVGLAHLVSGAVMAPGAAVEQLTGIEQPKPDWLRDWEHDSVGTFLGLTNVVGVSLPTEWWKADAWSSNDYFGAWQQDGWATAGSSVFNVGSVLLGGAGAAKAVGGVVRAASGVRTATIGELLETGGINALRGSSAAQLSRLIPRISLEDAERLHRLLRTPERDDAAIRALGIDHHVVRTSYEIAHDPVHSPEPAGKHWERQPDPVPVDPRLGRPRLVHGHSDPVAGADRPVRADGPETPRLMADPEAPFGRDAHGEPLTHHGYDRRFTRLEVHLHPADGEGHLRSGQRYPTGAEAMPGTTVHFDSVRAFTRVYGRALDRIGGPYGDWFAVEPKHGPFSFEARSIPASSLEKEYVRLALKGRLPDGFRIEVSEVASALGRPGGALQVRFVHSALGDHGKVVTLSMQQLIDERTLSPGAAVPEGALLQSHAFGGDAGSGGHHGRGHAVDGSVGYPGDDHGRSTRAHHGGFVSGDDGNGPDVERRHDVSEEEPSVESILGNVEAGLISSDSVDAEVRGAEDAAVAGRPQPLLDLVSSVERHLQRPDIGHAWANDRMLDRIRAAALHGGALHFTDVNFLKHEMIEERLMQAGMDLYRAHEIAGTSHELFENYHPETVQDNYDFSNKWRRHWGISPLPEP